MAGTPVVAVAIVSWNTRELLHRCLESLAPEADAGRAEVWVVDNDSQDDSVALVREQFPWAQLVEAGENLGFGRAVNVVAARTTTPWLAVANADVALRPRALELLLRAGEEDGGAGAIAPRLVLPDGTTQHSAFAFPSLSLALLVASGAGAALPVLARRHLLPGHFDADSARRVPWAVAAFLLVRREAWDAVGGFDERQWMYAEDLDLGWRLHTAGWPTRYEPHAEVEHASAAATAQAWDDLERAERHQRASYAWMLERLGGPRTRAIATILWLGHAVRFALLAPAARLAPSRYANRRDRQRAWMRLHRIGLRSNTGVRPLC